MTLAASITPITAEPETIAEAETLDSLRARAIAAERTVAVLKRKVEDLYNGGGSIIQQAAERARAREAEMRRRQELADLRNNELARYNAQLEGEVAARTRDLQVILDNVVFGFLVVNRDGTIRDGFTRSCTALLGTEQLAGRPVIDVLGLSPAQCAHFAIQLELLFDDVLPDELVLDQMPRRSTNADGRSLQIDGRAIRHASGALDGVLFTLTDVTALEAAQRETAHYRVLVQLLRQRDAFDAFVVDYRSLTDTGRAALAAGDQAAVRRVVHTMKGNAACFGLTDIAELAHRIEDAPQLDAAALDQLTAALSQFLDANADVLRIAHDAEPAIQLAAGELEALERLAGQGPAAIHAWIARARCRPAHVMLGPIEALVPRLAERFGKQVELVIEGSELRVDADLLRPVIRELGHVVRNAIDHGIEPADERAGKPATGNVTIRLTEANACYQLEIADDGRGIDLDRVISKVRAAGMCGEQELASRSRDELLRLVFIDGLSTAETTSDVSGRGVGMSAIHSAVTSIGGTIRIHSDPGRGTRIEIVVPRTTPLSQSTAA